MPVRINLYKHNQESVNRIVHLINASGDSIVNYIVEKGTKVLEEKFKELDPDLQRCFLEALKNSNQNNVKK